MKIIIFIVSFIASSELMAVEHSHLKRYEADYIIAHCDGDIDRKNYDNTRVDCYTEKYSYEYDWDYKWSECLTQALHYALVNNNDAACVLIPEHYNDTRYVQRAMNLISAFKLQVKLFIVDKGRLIEIGKEQ